MAAKKLPDVAFVRECVDYDPDTGIFTWRVRPLHHFADHRAYMRSNNIRAGKVAGSSTRDRSNYWQLRFGGIFYKAHRIAWLLVYGEPVPPMLDHIDGNPQNNRIANLRAVTINESAQNRRRPSHSSAGVKGVQFRQRGNSRKFYAYLTANKKRYSIGYFDTLAEAVAARREAAEKLHGGFVKHD